MTWSPNWSNNQNTSKLLPPRSRVSVNFMYCRNLAQGFNPQVRTSFQTLHTHAQRKIDRHFAVNRQIPRAFLVSWLKRAHIQQPSKLLVQHSFKMAITTTQMPRLPPLHLLVLYILAKSELSAYIHTNAISTQPHRLEQQHRRDPYTFDNLQM